MGKIIAIGGGEIGRPGYPVETTKIDKEIVRLSGKKNPKLLFIPTASGDAEGYVETVHRHFGERLGCKINELLLINKKPSKAEIVDKILGTDIVYAGGGSPSKLLRVWRKHGVDVILKQAYKKGVVLSGLSSGAACWFEYGLAGKKLYDNPGANYVRLPGLNIVPAFCTPHYNDPERGNKPEALKNVLKNTAHVAIALENFSAVEIVDNKYRIITSKPNTSAFKVYWKDGKFVEKPIIEAKNFRPLERLLQK